MPAKIRCEGCQSVITAPDRARGKKIRCPHCEAVNSVPRGKPQQKARRKAPARKSADRADVLANLDLDDVEDAELRVCPKCTAALDAEDILCPKCGIDLATGLLSAKQRKLQERSGPDPSTFYGESVRDAWAFLKNNKKLWIRTSTYSSLYTLLSLGCIFMVLWCVTGPPKFFWSLIATVAALAPFGWLWFLDGEIIRATLIKKKKLKRVNFDFFLNAAFGIKVILWTLIYPLPVVVVMGLIGMAFFFADMQIVAAVLLGVGFVMGHATGHIAMAHMAMPVTGKGWNWFSTFKTFLQCPGQTLYCAFLLLVTTIPVLALFGVAGGAFQRDIGTFVGAVDMNSQIARAQRWVDENQENKLPGADVEERKQFAAKMGRMQTMASDAPRFVDWSLLAIPVALIIGGCVIVGPIAVFNMRLNGTHALYFKADLDLITEVKQKEHAIKDASDLLDGNDL